MRLLANENFPGVAVEALRNRGHDVVWIRTDAPGSGDREVLARAAAETRTVVTFDKGFGALAFRYGLPAACGVILFRIPPTSPGRVAEIGVAVIESRMTGPGIFPSWRNIAPG